MSSPLKWLGAEMLMPVARVSGCVKCCGLLQNVRFVRTLSFVCTLYVARARFLDRFLNLLTSISCLGCDASNVTNANASSSVCG